MADAKISELTAYTTPLAADLFAIVDTANTTTKKITYANIRAAVGIYGAVVAPSGGDYTTLGAALAGGATRIFVRNGTYAETGENSIPSNTIITGESREGVVIDVDGTTNKRFLIGNGSNITKVQITNLTLKCTTATDSILDSANVAGSGIGSLLIENVNFDGGTMHLAAGSSSTVSGYLIVRNCYFSRWTNSLAAIWCRGTTGAFDYVEISNNRVDDVNTNPALAQVAINGASIDQYIVTGNTYIGGSYMIPEIQVTPSLATAMLYVDSNYAFGLGLIQNSTDNIGTKAFSNNFVKMKSGGAAIGLQTPSDDSYIYNNTFVDFDTGVKGFSSQDNCFIFSNNFENCAVGIQLESGSTGHIVTGNNFVNCTTPIVNNDSGNKIYNNTGEIPAIYDIIVRKMKNTSGGTLNAGDVVVLKDVAAGDEITTTTINGDPKVFGMVYDSSISNNAYGLIQTKGKTTALKVNGTNDIAIGDQLTPFTTAKIAVKSQPGDTVFAVALEAYSTDDSSGVIDALLINPFSVSAAASATISLTSSNITGMFATPVTLIPGITGKLIIPAMVTASFTVGGTQYTGGGNVRLVEETSGTQITENFFSAADVNGAVTMHKQSIAFTNTQRTLSKGIQISNQSGAFATGDGTMKVFILYYIVTP